MTSIESLKAAYVGKSLVHPSSVQSPASILDLAKIETNCQRMLDTVQRLGLGWRPHIKTHKTLELTRLQVGEISPKVNLVVSTVLEAETLIPLLHEFQAKGRSVNVLYAFPLYASAVPRLAAFCKTVGPKSLALMVDHTSQLDHVRHIRHLSGHPPLVYIKVDGSYHRAGVPLPSTEATVLISELLKLDSIADAIFHGLYIHAGHSYDTRHDWDALDYLMDEFEALATGAAIVVAQKPGAKLVLSVGATPTATSLQHPEVTMNQEPKVEGILATHARSADLLAAEDLAFTVLADVVSEYPGRGTNGTTEYLINAGCLALGREPCKDMGAESGVHYSGWGIPMSWPSGFKNSTPGPEFPNVHGGWQVGKISQEHGILMWKGPKEEEFPLHIGQRVRLWPNHACIAGAGFSYYLVVDSLG
ncbi:D-serine dehydratase [Ceratocystis platani]|uniref:D-serine dehydratase n=1 Tax=Ceratocystis fimbriata f. sp. platani TaxID=88771 RepID=A0A0F8B4S5_CERFI|nr:D-serine dehydratase [Ceratocystis platani]